MFCALSNVRLNYICRSTSSFSLIHPSFSIRYTIIIVIEMRNTRASSANILRHLRGSNF